MSRCATLRSDGMIASISPNSESTTSRLGKIEVDGAAPAPARVENLEQLVHQLEHRHERRVLRQRRRIAVGQDGVHLRIGHARVAVDDAVVHLVAHDVAAAIHFHQARLHEPIDVRVQAAQTGGQLRREHVDRALREVHRRAALVGFLVERASLLHVVRHVRDVHAKPVMAVRQPLDRDRVVEVARVLAVDRHRRDRTEVGPSAEVSFLDRPAKARGLLDRLVGVRVGDAVLANDDLRVDAGLVDPAEHFDHASDRPARRRRPPRDLDEHHLAGFGRRRLPGRHMDVGQHAAVERHDVAETRLVHLESADDGRLAALEDADDASLGPASPSGARRGRPRDRRASPPRGWAAR